jgi:plasmid stabilization system protein ParE
MKIRILPSAQSDLANGFAFYEKQGNRLGGYFMESLFSEIDSLRLYGGIHRKVFGYHRLLSRRFPYAIYYSREAQTLFVRAVLDCRSDPGSIRDRLEA